MNQISNPSFIPKNPTTQPNKRVRRKSASMTLATFLTLTLFIVSLVSAGALFFYDIYLNKSIAEKRVALAQAEKSFNPDLIKELKRLDIRLKAAKSLLNQHIAFTQFFELLSANTLSNVQFENFKSNADPSGVLRITADGRARSFDTVTLQSEQFKNTTFLNNPSFKNLDLDERGNVKFSFEANVPATPILYSSGVEIIQDDAAGSSEGGIINNQDAAEATSTATSTDNGTAEDKQPGS